MLNLIIKGPMALATAEALTRNILLTEVREHNLPNHVETLAKCHDTFRPEVAVWFSEPPTTRPPYPEGTLLWFGETNSGEAVEAALDAVDLNFGRKANV